MTKSDYENEILLGFELRQGLERLPQWDAERRAMFLLDEQLEIPLSVDRAVWSEVEDKRALQDLFSNFWNMQYAAPNGLSVFELKDSSNIAAPSRRDDSFLIAITAATDSYNRLVTMHKIDPNPVSLQSLHASGWQCLGYDVADDWFISGLMNCGYEPDEKNLLRTQYGPFLNAFGLFCDLNHAEAFCKESDGRVNEHSPFHVFGIWANGKPS